MNKGRDRCDFGFRRAKDSGPAWGLFYGYLNFILSNRFLVFCCGLFGVLVEAERADVGFQ